MINYIEKKHLYTSDEKLKRLGYGEWVEEFDSVIFEYLKYKCAIFRVFKDDFLGEGYLCGSINIPKKHPYYAKEDLNYLECHGGVAYNETYDSECWIGFHCGHANDLIPSLVKNYTHNKKIYDFKRKSALEDNPLFTELYRNIDYVINECKRIVDQLNALVLKS